MKRNAEHSNQLGLDLGALPICTDPNYPRAHSYDPASSFDAGEMHRKSGRLQTNLERVLAGVRQYTGRTSEELAVLIGLGYHEVARRLPELREASLIRSDDTGSRLRWWPK